MFPVKAFPAKAFAPLAFPPGAAVTEELPVVTFPYIEYWYLKEWERRRWEEEQAQKAVEEAERIMAEAERVQEIEAAQTARKKIKREEVRHILALGRKLIAAKGAKRREEMKYLLAGLEVVRGKKVAEAARIELEKMRDEEGFALCLALLMLD